MLSSQTLDQYRKMTVSQRFELVGQMIRENTPALLVGPPEVVDRRFELIRRQNDERNRRLLAGLARTKKRP